MRIKRKLNKKIKIAIFILLIIIGFLIFNSNIKEITNSLHNKTQIEKNEYQDQVTGIQIDENIKNLIIKFLNTYFRSMKELKEYDLTTFFASDAYEQAYLNQTALNVLISSRTKQINDLKLDKVSFDIEFKSIETNDNIITIEFIENSSLNFNFMKKTTSNIYNVFNKIEIIKENNEYKINSFDKEQGYYIMVKNLYSFKNQTNDNIKKELDQIKTNYINIFDKMLVEQQSLYTEYSNNQTQSFKSCDYEYNRDKALEYALKYVTKRNNTDYGEYGGNCQNFGSWVLNAGGIPMDIEGNYQWKHYGTIINNFNIKEGRTASWTGVLSFYEYAKNNTGYGLCSKVDVNTYFAEPGDIIQIGYDNAYRHTAVVVGTKKENNLVQDILLNSNTGDLEQFPLSAYIYPEKRLIKILGWND